jgi:hypothetical protein
MKLSGICVFFFILLFSLGCKKANESENDLLTLDSWGSGIGRYTDISMAGGLMKKITDIHSGDNVILDDGSVRKITTITNGRVIQIISITTNNGRTIALTVATPIKTPVGWITAGELNVGQQIAVESGIDTVAKASMQSYNNQIYSLYFAEGETAFIANGFIIGDEAISKRLWLEN